MVTHPFGDHAQPCLTLVLKNTYSCSVPPTLPWFLVSRSRITTILTVLHQVMIHTLKRCDPGPPLITRRKSLLLMLPDRYIDRGPFITDSVTFSDSLTVYRSIPLERFPYHFISYISVLLLLPLMTSGQYSNHSVLFGDLSSREKQKCVQEMMAGWCSGRDEGGVLTVGMMTPSKWRCQGWETVLFLKGARSSLWLCGERMCCFCSQCGSRNVGIAGCVCFSFPSFCFRSRHLTHACMASFTPLNMMKFRGWLQWLFTCCWNFKKKKKNPSRNVSSKNTILFQFLSASWVITNTHEDSVTVYHKYPIVKALRASSFTANTCWPKLRFSATPTDLSETVCLGYMRKTSERLHVEDRRPKQIAMLSSRVGFWFRFS